MDLPVTNLVVAFDEACGSDAVLVPCIISRLFQVDGGTDKAAGPASMSNLYQAIDFIDLYCLAVTAEMTKLLYGIDSLQSHMIQSINGQLNIADSAHRKTQK